MSPSYWWSSTTNHLWRAYFALINSNPETMSPANRKKFTVCNTVYNQFPQCDRDIIRAYYTCKWGDSVYAVEDYSARTGIPVSTIYAVITSASRSVIRELGLIDE